MSKPLIRLLGQGVRYASKLRGGGSAFPGLVMEKLHPEFVAEELAKLPYGVVVVSGTNGKTTTTSLTAFILNAAGLDPPPPLPAPAEAAPPQGDQGEGDEAREGRRRQEQTRDKVEDGEPRQRAGQKALRRPAQRGEGPDAFLFHESIIPGGAACRLTGAGRRGLSLRSARANPDAHRVGDRGDWRP